MAYPSWNRRALLPLVALAGLLAGAARGAEGTGARCMPAYAQAFLGLNNLAGERRLRAESAPAAVRQLFGERPVLCEPGAYDLFLDQLMQFTRRALRSGATPQTPKEGWVLAAAAACAFAPRTVPAGEYAAVQRRLRAAQQELAALVGEAGGGPVPAALVPALAAAAPSPASAPAPVPVAPRAPAVAVPAQVPESEPAPPLAPEKEAPRAQGSLAPDAAAPGAAPSQADDYFGRGAGLYRQGHYLEAAAEMEKAYLVRPKPIYLFNTAQAYRRGGRPREALRLYRDFLARDPATPLRAETTGYITDMEAVLKEQERAERAGQALASEKQQTAQARQDLVAERQRAERERKRPVYRRAWFWAVLATSVAVVGAGVAVGVVFTRDPKTDGGIVNLHF